MKLPEIAVIDFETAAIQSRPKYPPVPVGCSYLLPGEKTPHYLAWGHPEHNNIAKNDAARILRKVWKENDLLGQNMKFDYDVGVTHLGLPRKPWHAIHDTMFLIFLHDPHAPTLRLKDNAERLLGIKPKERDALRDWILQNIPGSRKGDWGAYISRAPGDLVGRYSAQGDAMQTMRLFQYLWPRIVRAGMQRAYDRERQLMPILLENEREGLRVDQALLRRHVPQYEKALSQAEAWICRALRTREPINFDAPKELAAALLRAPRGMVDKRSWERTPKNNEYSTKKEVLDEVVKDKRLRLALKYRGKLDTYLSMFLRQWRDTAEETGGRIHTTWNQVRQPKGSDGDSRQGTRTGRPSSSPNFLNIPKNLSESDPEYRHPGFMRVLELPTVRRYILPDKGHVFLHRDYNQQELRILAHYEAGKLAEAYRKDSKMDVHNFVRDEIKRVSGLTMIRREVKIINFGIIYGMGVGKLAKKLQRDVEGAGDLKSAHRAALPGVKDLEKAIKARAKEDKPIRTWGGRLYYCEEPRIVDEHVQTFEYKLLNYLIQGGGADCTKQAIIDYHSVAKRGRFMVTVYDEINIGAPPGAARKEMGRLREAMEAQKFDVPMITDGKYGPSWGQLKTFKE